MTENEAQKWLEKFEWDDSEETSEALATICEALQEYPKFRAIGTIEEFKALKVENEELHCEIQAINATMDLLENEIRAKAIDEFVHKVKEHQYVLSDVINSKDYGMFTIGIEQIAEQLKAGGENEND